MEIYFPISIITTFSIIYIYDNLLINQIAAKDTVYAINHCKKSIQISWIYPYL